MKAIDTNILIRFITKDNENQAKLVYQLFKQAEQTEQKRFYWFPSSSLGTQLAKL